MGVVADLMVLVGANVTGFKTGMSEVSKGTEEAGAKTEKMGGLIAGAGVMAAGAITGVIAFGVEALKHTEEAGQAAFEMSEKFGLTGEQASGYMSVGKQLGLSNEQIGKGFQTLSKQMENLNLSSQTAQTKDLAKAQVAADADATKLAAATQHLADVHAQLKGKTTLTVGETISLRNANDAVTKATDAYAQSSQRLTTALAGVDPKSATTTAAFKSMGISVFDTQGKLKSVNDLMLESADVFQDMKDGPEKSGLAMKLFGKAGADLLPMLSQGSAGIKKMLDTGKAQGAVMSTEQVEAAHKLFLEHKQLDSAIAGVTNQIGSALMPIAVAAIPVIMGFVGQISNTHAIITRLQPWFPLLGAGLILLGGVMAAVLIPMFIAWTVATWAQVTALAAQAVAMLAAYWPILLIIVAIAAVVAVVILVVQHWDFLKAKTLEVWSTIKTHVLGIVDWFKSLPATFMTMATGIGTSIVNGIVNGISALKNNILNAIKNLLPGGANGPVVLAMHAAGIPGFALGGTVPGYSGQPQLILAHGGETVTPVGGVARSAPSTVVHNHYYDLSNSLITDGPLLDVLANKIVNRQTIATGR